MKIPEIKILNRRRFILESGLCAYEIRCHPNVHESMRYTLLIQRGSRHISLLASKDVLRKFANNLLNDIAELEAENENQNQC